MRAYFLFLALCGYAYSEGISTKNMDPKMPITIQISQDETTTLQFPERVTQVFGLGLSSQGTAKGATVETKTTEDGTVVVLRALTRQNGRMTTKMGGRWYVFTLTVGDHPDIVTTLVSGETPTGSKKGEEVDEKEVVDSRPNYNPVNMERLMDLSRTSALTKASIPSEYIGYNFKTCSYKSSDNAISTEVTKVHTWDNQDTVVVEATVTNNSGSDLQMDLKKMSLAIGKEQHPITFMRKAMSVPPKQSEYITAMVVGDYDGSRGRFNIKNEFRLIVNGDARNYATTDPTPVATPTPDSTPEVTPSPSKEHKKGQRP